MYSILDWGRSTQELSLYILLPMLEFRELIVLDNLITGKACHGGIEQTSAAIAFTHSWFKCLGK
jgi:hypothetical protein